MSSTNVKRLGRRVDRSNWEPPPFISSPGLSIVIDKKLCTGCDFCILACPTDCLELDTDVMVAYVLRLDACILCYSCEDVCKPDCIHVLLDKNGGDGEEGALSPKEGGA